MKRIEYQGNGNHVQAHLHALVTDGENLLLASMIDNDSSVRGVAANISEGHRILTVSDLNRRLSWGDQDEEEKGTTKRYFAFGGGAYKIVSRVVESPIVHTLIVHKAAVIGETQANPIILALEGDLPLAVGERLAVEYALPRLESWFKPLYDRLLYEGLLQELETYTSPDVEMWRDLKAVRAHMDLTEDRMMEIVSEGLRNGWLVLPEGDVNAPKFEGGEDVTLPDYLKQYAPYLVSKVKNKYKPLHDIDQPLMREIATMKRIPFPAQAHAIQALVKGFLGGRKMLFDVADMGVGKTLMSIGVAHVLHEEMKKRGQDSFRVLVMAPGGVVPKWVRDEIRPTLPNARTRILSNYADVLKYSREEKKPGLEFVLISRDRAKLGMKHRPAVVWKRLKGQRDFVWHCGCCGQPITVKGDKDAGVSYAEWEHFALGEAPTAEDLRGPKAPDGLPIDIKIKWKSVPRSLKCEAVTTRTWIDANKMPQEEERVCNAPLMRPAMKQRFFFRSLSDPWTIVGTTKKNRQRVKKTVTVSEGLNAGRWEPAKLIQKYLKFDFGIIDELHQYKGESGQGEAFASVVSACKWTLGLTGTLTSGKASDLYRILFRSSFNRLRDDGFTTKEPMDWVRRYGVLETVIKHDNDDEGVMTRRKRDKKTVKELPGIAPQLYVKHIMDSAVFVELQDIGLPVVAMSETPVFVNLDEEHQESYNQFHSDLEDACKQAVRAGVRGAYSKFLPAVINYADQPQREYNVVIGDDLISPHEFFDVDYESAKERRLVEDVKAELAQDRGVVIFGTYTDSYAQDERIGQVLAKHGIKCSVLKSTVAAEERIAWLEAEHEKGTKVICCNMQLVETGLDMLQWPTIIFFQGNDKIATVRQASRRAWRIGQHRECKVIFYVNNSCYQVEQFKRMMSKRSHALLLEGRLDKSDLARFGGDDKHSSLTKSVTDCLVDVDDLSAKWAELAAKDIPQGLDMLEEDEFQAVVKEVKMKLWSQTRELCGVEELVEMESTDTSDGDISALADLFIQKQQDIYTASFTGGQLDLFSTQEDPAYEPPKTMDFGTSDEEHYQIVDMGDVLQRIKNKRKKKETVAAGQLGWDLFDVTL